MDHLFETMIQFRRVRCGLAPKTVERGGLYNHTSHVKERPQLLEVLPKGALSEQFLEHVYMFDSL
ncbi:hypothetical protein DPMN_075724 [Dreissena polymorpha]|uniref:Uncharacterized protein n=1 Tax=Dreissena polymorpha TaxID=45954 RepID=A0A9D3YKY1_DREPO|nr:hypothetical protein DPMN_075724 [Dreissena polymorpha]